ncbi:MAG: FeoB-associated Cys-rich membrane protein [Porcipelethomonas sp.]
MATVIIGLIVAGILFLSARQLYMDKKKGKSLCGGKCTGCPGGCNCHGACKDKTKIR